MLWSAYSVANTFSVPVSDFWSQSTYHTRKYLETAIWLMLSHAILRLAPDLCCYGGAAPVIEQPQSKLSDIAAAKQRSKNTTIAFLACLDIDESCAFSVCSPFHPIQARPRRFMCIWRVLFPSGWRSSSTAYPRRLPGMVSQTQGIVRCRY